MKKISIFVILVIIPIAIVGLFYLANISAYLIHEFKTSGSIPPSGIIPLPTGKNCQATAFSKEKAFLILSPEIDKALSSGESQYIKIDNIKSEDLEKIALAYGVITQNECGPKIFVRLEKGGWINLKEVEKSDFDRWYLTINACVNNKRVVLDPFTGEQVGPLHTYVICGGVI